jgi:hypothetical protein
VFVSRVRANLLKRPKLCYFTFHKDHLNNPLFKHLLCIKCIRHISYPETSLSLLSLSSPLETLYANMASQRRLRLGPRVVHVGFLVDKLALGQILLQVIRFFPVSNIASASCSFTYRCKAYVTDRIFNLLAPESYV